MFLFTVIRKVIIDKIILINVTHIMCYEHCNRLKVNFFKVKSFKSKNQLKVMSLKVMSPI
jgi:hypothetical protein